MSSFIDSVHLKMRPRSTFSQLKVFLMVSTKYQGYLFDSHSCSINIFPCNLIVKGFPCFTVDDCHNDSHISFLGSSYKN